jgi:hypothetical protein
MAQAATVMAADPAALQLRLLQAVVEVAAEEQHACHAVPVELLRFFDRARRSRHSLLAATDADGPVPSRSRRAARPRPRRPANQPAGRTIEQRPAG